MPLQAHGGNLQVHDDWPPARGRSRGEAVNFQFVNTNKPGTRTVQVTVAYLFVHWHHARVLSWVEIMVPWTEGCMYV